LLPRGFFLRHRPLCHSGLPILASQFHGLAVPFDNSATLIFRSRIRTKLFHPPPVPTCLQNFSQNLRGGSMSRVQSFPPIVSQQRSLRKEQLVESRPVDEPIMAIVSLRDQQITVYDAKGRIMRAPVSSGQKGRETPAGIFTVLQKEAEHYSNIYDDAYMPHMQRLTWTGIALHGGPLPGYPASHGCIRMPYDF